ncbi:NAD(P)-binding protein [Setomelanomma holmii]|uniref:NAD(P)-binding protein n=1 Tax=Setomelanomma holmii TaxID=210430 RepID=A0A9P4HBS0_9PLEO|nr:NAD(P)-binding protein [Setomelanomma holmii]
MSSSRLRIGIIGAGEVAQVCHLPVLALLKHLYSISIICDISEKNAKHCASKFHIPTATTKPTDVFNSNEVDVVFILTSDEFHESYTIAALFAGKHVFVEKPLSLSSPSVQRIIDAEKAANGPRVFVGYMRRHAASFTQTFKREVESIPRILYARSRDFSGPNKHFVDQSGTFQVKNTDFPADAEKAKDEMLDTLYKEAFPGQRITETHVKYCRFLGGLGSHDISLMREVLGFPESVSGVSVNPPFYSAILNHRNKAGKQEPFAVTYESGIDAVPDFDAHLAVYGEKKRVLIKYDSPYVKGLPIKVVVQEVNDYGEIGKREIIGSYEDAYTSEFLELFECFANGKEIKTSATDALNDVKIYDMMYSAWNASRS